jgi:hypothetical protein
MIAANHLGIEAILVRPYPTGEGAGTGRDRIGDDTDGRTHPGPTTGAAALDSLRPETIRALLTPLARAA